MTIPLLETRLRERKISNFAAGNSQSRPQSVAADSEGIRGIIKAARRARRKVAENEVIYQCEGVGGLPGDC